jgi:hypothetical protein
MAFGVYYFSRPEYRSGKKQETIVKKVITIVWYPINDYTSYLIRSAKLMKNNLRITMNIVDSIF